MNITTQRVNRLIGIAATSLVLSACSTPPTTPDGARNARDKLTALQSNPQLASLAPVAVKEAERAVTAAEQPTRDVQLANHLVLMADHKVDIARARAQSRQLEDERAMLGKQRTSARLDARTREADSARLENEELRRNIADLQARETDRGLVVTLGDLLFATGKSDLKGGAAVHLGKLAAFLNEYQDRSVIIEGHTDNVGSDDSNMSLSRRRADSVRAYLVGQGVERARISTSGMGEGAPVADNDTDSGRQQNRRVEVIISNQGVSMR